MTTTAGPGARAIRCRYLRRDGNRCPNEIAGQGDEEILLCGRHLLRAHQLFLELATQTRGELTR